MLKLLGKVGCLTDIAVNGMEGMEMTEKGNYDIIFMDCLMPKIDGFEATLSIRSHE